MRHKPLNEFSREELEAALREYLNEKTGSQRNCRFCGTSFTQNRRWQEFCRTACKTAFHRQEKDVLLERATNRVLVLEKDLDLYKRLWSRVPVEWREQIERDET